MTLKIASKTGLRRLPIAVARDTTAGTNVPKKYLATWTTMGSTWSRMICANFATMGNTFADR